MRVGTLALTVVVTLGVAVLAEADPTPTRDLAGLVAPYLRARDDQAVGDIQGHSLGDAARPTAPPVPYDGVSVMLFPRSPDFESQLTAIKAHLRDSLNTYIGATAEVTEARMAYERDLLAVGGGELIRGEVSNAQGDIRLNGVPAGDWVLLAWRDVAHPGKAPKLRGSDTTGFRNVPVEVGYSTITYWFMPLTVKAGESTSVDLNDRNVWLTGIHEDIRTIEGTPKKHTGSGLGPNTQRRP
jgi:hypothetical protein